MNLETQRLFMRPIRAWDADALHRLQCDPLIVELTMQGIPPTREMSDAQLSFYLQEWQTYGIGFWMVYEREDNGDLRFVGRSGVSRFNDSDILIGCALFGATSGRRIGPESLKPVIELALTTQPVDRLLALISPTNTRSLRMATGLGFSCLGPIVAYGTEYQCYEMRRPTP
ncbi:GNAT family N-acetyltransferase [Mesorhizobium sp.]|uniref:GNAT family N-acetyltransferase n=1 Tax=Mesorhizobium sp. TaxID=1871066 RepID=UPI00121BD7ED|nr:GNAT family N-acetyltransferase [Mesorhizobium sp.]TIV60217.1 MAG: GNAT family N-acetyltransferase [Mesorhizobium sp.]